MTPSRDKLLRALTRAHRGALRVHVTKVHDRPKRPRGEPSFRGRVRLDAPRRCSCGQSTAVSPCWNCDRALVDVPLEVSR